MTELIPLSLTSSYCSNWGTWEVCREFLANAIDADEDFTFGIHEDSLVITSNGGTIPKEYLLMGGGSKSGGDSNIGHHSEGAKVAMVVALREGLSIQIENGNQMWTPELHYSESFGTEHLHVKVEEMVDPHVSDVVVTISGLSPLDVELIEKNFIGFQEDLEVFETSKGQVLLDDHMKGCVYVGGMFVCVDTALNKGYNFNPNELKLDRDRSLARIWDIVAITDTMISEMSQEEEHEDTVVEMIDKGCQDTTHLAWHSNDVSEGVIDKLHQNFVDTHGEDAIMAESFEEKTQLSNSGYKKVIYTGNSVAAKLVKKSSNYRTLNSHVQVKTCDDYLQEFLDKYEDEMSNEMFNDFEDMQTILNSL